jgi:hypothetical protein
MFEPKANERSEVQFHYLRTTGLLRAKVALTLPDSSGIRFFSENDAAVFVESMRRRNVVARLGGSNNHYLMRAAELSNRTVIEVIGVGTPETMLAIGEAAAALIEKLAVLSTTLVIRRPELLRKLGIAKSMSAEVNLAVTGQFKRIRSRSQRAPIIEGLLIDQSFCSRFNKCGFIPLLKYLDSKSDLSTRVRISADWLLESRRESSINATVVKTAIALESLLIFAESESLGRTLSERAAFILSNSPEVRRKISNIILRFYDVRSGVVHGSQKKAKKLTPSLTECVERLTLMLYLVIASNSDLWPTVESLRLWCEDQRWDKPFTDVKFPLTGKYLNTAVALEATEKRHIGS